jgi:NAD(P)H-nitrite reductase large subunit
MNYVVVGNGPAGTGAVEAIREVDREGRITVISDEAVKNYSKPLISYLLAKKVKKNQLAQREEDFYERRRVELVLKKKAVKLEIDSKNVVLGDRGKIPFDKLLIATGGSPIPLSIIGQDAGGIFSFTRLEDVEALTRYMRESPVQKAVVVGGGLIGLKATEALIERGITVTIVELADRILSTTFDRKASEIIAGVLKKEGCQVLLQNTLSRIIADRSKKVKAVILRDERKIPCDLVILAVGVVPNCDLVKGTAIRCDRGILVDAHMQTSLANIYAAGDCCQVQDFFTKTSRVIPIWPNALRQGKIAGSNMAGRVKEYEGALAMNSVELCGIPTISVGMTDPPEDEGYEKIEFLNEKKSIYKKLVLRGEVIVGALFVGDINRAGIYTGLIKESVKVQDLKGQLLKETFGLIHLPKEYRKHFVTGEGMEV